MPSNTFAKFPVHALIHDLKNWTKKVQCMFVGVGKSPKVHFGTFENFAEVDPKIVIGVGANLKGGAANPFYTFCTFSKNLLTNERNLCLKSACPPPPLRLNLPLF